MPSLSNWRVTCPYCLVMRSVKPPGFRKIYQCKCGAWGISLSDGDFVKLDWHAPDEARPDLAEDKAVWFRRLFSELAPDILPPLGEYRFHPRRKWLFDAAWPYYRVAVEIDGGNRLVVEDKRGRPRAVGRHTQSRDYEKRNAAVEEGWRVLAYTTEMLRRDPAGCIAQVKRVLEARMEES